MILPELCMPAACKEPCRSLYFSAWPATDGARDIILKNDFSGFSTSILSLRYPTLYAWVSKPAMMSGSAAVICSTHFVNSASSSGQV
eukprot:CAMPEP_0198245626 /NCGR_PEP_ID=MMETSP1446-20131203/41963_1 /TAXON_ID=1461542 ORGANISM="Unidentified sp, Strain CCMP2111" /NCGR_SAMPLE_ID=MMETSP1446 /ASSEMBLY_ACC=CAM_ASM_001112 /LENGTH=86 /DNA_ID=CAMNT_0043929841 /DNA_START=85 /DNA_END=345 /DNA_ORIENTATION=+